MVVKMMMDNRVGKALVIYSEEELAPVDDLKKTIRDGHSYNTITVSKNLSYNSLSHGYSTYIRRS